MTKFLKIISYLPILSLTACSSYFGNYWTPTDNYAKPIGQSRVTDNETVYSNTLKCLAEQIEQKQVKPDVMTVSRVLDYTGKDDLETGRRLTQGATLMVISALGKAGIPQVERFDTSVNEFELKMKDNKLIKNSIDGDERAYQPILAGSLVGSKYTLMGGITELNYNIRSNDMNALFDIASGGMRYYVMNIAMDFRLVETETLKIISTVSYQKQIIGREVQAGVFKFFDNKLLDVGIGERSLEPMQLAVRSISELAVYDLVNDLYEIPRAYCYNLTLPEESAVPTVSTSSYEEGPAASTVSNSSYEEESAAYTVSTSSYAEESAVSTVSASSYEGESAVSTVPTSYKGRRALSVVPFISTAPFVSLTPKE